MTIPVPQISAFPHPIGSCIRSPSDEGNSASQFLTSQRRHCRDQFNDIRQRNEKLFLRNKFRNAALC
jgi:hypothetical protein